MSQITDSENHEENLLLMGIIKIIKTSHDEGLICNILDALQKLFELDEVYGLGEDQSVLESFKDTGGLEGLDACILRHAASDLDG